MREFTNGRILLWLVSSTWLLFGNSPAAELDGVVVRFDKYEGLATLAAQLVGPQRLKIEVDPKTEREDLMIRVELPVSGRHAWSAADVEVRDAQGRALAVRRSGIEWHNLLVCVPAVRGTYFVEAVAQREGQLPLATEKDRYLTDQATGLSVMITRWYDGRQAALSIRFDDSHPTHLSKAIPILREYGFRGTFMVNPG